ncbi:TetR/AcrR family transcriptional regulator [Lentilactobacillus sp. Marseille-Q4993]|uniref:TetR/AcrR family transcriptional regulator n=1 Tax=Lentilactobacillus sp. Marseille-Q4993 TaxID=3039492 RepID=UPI0024BCACED|nr:TetR/AcrR family transcriptional regulator [Lentilactobacillus sp. Marseille-Q4993]
MVGTKDNRRTQITKRLLKDALLSILQTKPLDKVTITEITNRADVNRGTFYLHYNTPQELFNAIEDDLISEIKPMIDEFLIKNSSDFLANLLTTIKENSPATTVILQDIESNRLLNKLIQPLRSQTKQRIEAHFHEADPEVNDMYFDFCMAGSVNIILKWLATDSQLTAAQVAEVIYKSVPYAPK